MGAGTAALNHSPGPVELAAERQRRNRRPASDQETGLGMEGIAHDWFLLTISPGGPEAAWDARGSGNTPYLFTFSSSHPVGRRPTFAHLLSAHRSPPPVQLLQVVQNDVAVRPHSKAARRCPHIMQTIRGPGTE